MVRNKDRFKIKKCHPRIFWTECEICRKEYKKEDGWKVIYANDTVFSHFVCKRCAPTEEKASELAGSGLAIKMPLLVPPKIETIIKELKKESTK